VTVTAATVRPITLAFAALPSSEALRARIEAAIPEDTYYDDLHGAPAWRRHMTFRFAEEVRRELADTAPS
jgi:hypothetical protein